MSGTGLYAQQLADFVTSVLNEVPGLPPPLPPVLLGNGAANNGAGGLSLTVPRPGGYFDGCVLIAFIANQNTGGTPTPPAGWTQDNTVVNGMRLTTYWRVTDGGANDPPGGYQWTTGSAVLTLGGILCMGQTSLTAPIDSHDNKTGTATSLTSDSIAIVKLNSFVYFAAVVDKDEDINAIGGTLLMTEQFEPRSTRNMAVWTQPWLDGSPTGTRGFSISTGISQPLALTIGTLNPAQ